MPLLQRLKARCHVDQIAISPGAASVITNPPGDLLVGPAAEILRTYWVKAGKLLVVGAISAVTRLIAPLIKGKDQDPAVVVLDANALMIVPLLGGHKAGGEDLVIQLAEDLGGRPILTGDSRSQGRILLDCFGDAWGWRRQGDCTSWKNLMLNQAKGCKLEISQSSGSRLWQTTEGAKKLFNVCANEHSDQSIYLSIGPHASKNCCWHPPTIWIGVGCERNTSISILERALEISLDAAGLNQEAIAGFASIDLKDDEPALLAFVEEKQWPIRFFGAESLNQVSVPTPSEKVLAETGTASVAESSALLAAGEGSVLYQAKKIFYPKANENGAITIAIAEALKPFAPSRGELHLVGSGPGDLALLTNDARFALSRSAVWIGYGLYLDLIEPLRRNDQVRIEGELTKEKDRCIKALELATEGVRVSLISSGDSGIYGMAGLALQLWLDKPEDERPELQIHPGISAMQMAASKVGAPLMHDFCAISLSDCLTPWGKIEERLLAAACGDFVIGLYNPKSKVRTWQLPTAINLLRKHRPAETPVVLARQLGRTSEKVTIYNLDNIPIEEVDMLSLLLIGNSASLLKDGWLLNPRGYSVH